MDITSINTLIFIETIITFLVFGIDKWFAIRHQWRIPEIVLLALSFLGGSVGGILAMVVFRHKISKISFLLKFCGVVVLQLALIYGLQK